MTVTRAWQRYWDRYWGLAVLALWGGILLGGGLLRLDPLGVDEAAARALLLAWSVGERVISTAFVFGLPDLRALAFAPLGIYWPGSMIAAKVFTLLITFTAATLLYRWSRRSAGPETALIATGLLLIAPVTLLQMDTLGAGPYLLLCLGLAHWMDRRYRRAQRPLGGWFFLQLLLIMTAVSLHPAGLAYPLALLWEWHKRPEDERQQRHIYIGTGLAVTFILVMRMGWQPLGWLNNPLPALSAAVLGGETVGEALPWMTGALLAAMLLYLLIAERGAVQEQLMHRMLLGGILLGLPAADGTWAMLAVTVLLYLGVPRLIALNESFGGTGFLRQRGVVMAAVFFAAMLFMQADKGHMLAMAQNLLPPTDRLILTLTAELEDLDKEEDVLVMSQWPGKTMLALKRPVLPLPPDYPDSETLLKNIAGVTHLLFDPFDPANKSLSDNLAKASEFTKTLALEEGGVIVVVEKRTKD